MDMRSVKQHPSLEFVGWPVCSTDKIPCDEGWLSCVFHLMAVSTDWQKNKAGDQTLDNWTFIFA